MKYVKTAILTLAAALTLPVLPVLAGEEASPTPAEPPVVTAQPTEPPAPTASPTALPLPAMPQILDQPKGAVVRRGEAYTLSVQAQTGDEGEISYLWYSSTQCDMAAMIAVDRGGETGQSLAADTSQCGVTYYCVMATNTLHGEMASVYSQIVAVTVEEPEESIERIEVIAAPTHRSYQLHESLDSSGLVLRLWTNRGYRDVTEGFSCQPERLDVAGVQEIEVSYHGHSTSFQVAVQAQLPIILQQPQGMVVTVGQSAQLSVVSGLAGSGELSYLWYSSATPDMSTMAAVNRGRETSSTLTLDTRRTGTTYYWVLVMNTDNGETASLYSSMATVTVTLPATPTPAPTPSPVPTAQPTPTATVPPAAPPTVQPSPPATREPDIPSPTPSASVKELRRANMRRAVLTVVACAAAAAAGVSGYAFWRLRRRKDE